MSVNYKEDEITQQKFLFVSYSHKDETIVHETINYLFEQGVQLWHDEKMHNGDTWDVVAQEHINHENCVGVLFFNSKYSYLSEAVSKERQLTIEKQKQWEKAGKTFHIFVINLSRPTTLGLMRELLLSLPDDDYAIAKELTTEKLSIVLEMFNDKRLYTHLSEENKQTALSSFLEDIISKVPEIHNTNNLIFTKIKNSDDSDKSVLIDFASADDKKIKWILIDYDEEKSLFLSTEILGEDYGGNVERWLSEKITFSATDSKDKLWPKESLRLLSIAETKELSEDLMKLGQEWWLADKRGSLQSIVRDDGTIYLNGYNNKRYSKGIRPVLTLTAEHIAELLAK